MANWKHPGQARGTLSGRVFGNRPSIVSTSGLGSLGEDEGSWTDIFASDDSEESDGGGAEAAITDYLPSWAGGTSSTPAVEDDGSCINLPSSPSGLDCRYGFKATLRTTNTGKTCYTCSEVPTGTDNKVCPPGLLPNPATGGCSQPTGAGGMVPDVVNGKVTCPDGMSTLNPKTGLCVSSVANPWGVGPSKPTPSAPKPSPKPGPVVEPESASIWGNPLVWAGIALVGGVGLVAYKKSKKRKMAANWGY